MRIHRPFMFLGFFVCLAWLTSCAVGVEDTRGGVELTPAEQEQVRKSLDVISDETLLDYVKTLSSEDFAGRLTGTPEYKAAARWVAARMKAWPRARRGQPDLSAGLLQSV